MTNKKHEYSSMLLLVLGVFLLVGFAVSVLDSEDIDDVCSTNNTILRKLSGTWGCDTMHFAEGHYQSYATPIEINVTSQGVYYNITGYESFLLRGFTTALTGVRCNKNGVYRLVGTMSFYGGNSGDYEVALFVNGAEKHECAFQRSTSSNAIGDATLTCIQTLNSGDLLNMRVKDMSAPAQDIYIHALNFNIVEVV